ncbi:leucine-rich repeat protein, partial [Tanacetum coccineum]
LISIDLSNNNFSGKPPSEITNLVELVLINVSFNKLHGEIPNDMGRLNSLGSLDLLRNDFSGNMPSILLQIDGLEITLYFVDPHLHKDVKGLHLLLPLIGKEMMKKMEMIFEDHISWGWALDLLLDFGDHISYDDLRIL